MMPSASWWTTSACAMRGWRWSRPRRRYCTMDWRCSACPPRRKGSRTRQEHEPVKNSQQGSVIVGIIIGVVLGLAAALAVAVYVTKVPVPFLNKGQSRTAEQDAAETRKNRDWDPNAPLYGKNPAKPLPPAPGPAAAASGSPAPAAPVATIPAPASA